MDTETRLAHGRGLERTRRAWRAALVPFVVSRLVSNGLVAIMVSISNRRIVSQGFALFDGRWYLAIARGGYPSLVAHHGQTTWAFFPLYPAAIHVVGATGMPGWVAGVVISHVAFYVALVGLYRLVARRCSPTAAELAVWSLALFPAAFIFSLVYPSSVFLAASVWAFVFADEHRDLTAGLAAATAALIRPNGLVVAIALTFAVGFAMPRVLRVVGPSIIAVAGWMAFNLAKTGDAVKFFDAKRAWPEVTLLGFTGRFGDTALLHVILAAVALGTVLAAARRIPRSWTVLAELSLIPSLALGIVGLGRYANECFAPFAAAGELLTRCGRRVRSRVFATLIIGQVLFAYWIVALRHVP